MRIANHASLALTLLAACGDPTSTLRPTSAARAAAGSDAAAGTAGPGVVMSGLDAPRGLAWGPEGGLYVVEAGTRAPNGPCVQIARGSTCYSGTGAVTRLFHGRQERIASGMPSGYNPLTLDIGGPSDISFQGRGNGYVTLGWGADPALRSALGPLGAQEDVLVRMTPNGQWSPVADIGAFETAHNPAGGPYDSNAYGVLAEPGRVFVTDAGGNSLLEVSTGGVVSLVATFPSTVVPPGPFAATFSTSEAVPTEVVRGPDGALYVSTLSGAPFLPGAARIYRVVPGQAPTVYAAGFTQVTDFDWGSDGTLYVLQYASGPFFAGAGSVVRVAPDGARTTIVTGLANPTGILAGPDGAIYVSNKGNLPAVGEVLRIVP